MKFLKLLKKLRNLSDHKDHKISCVIAKRNQVISIGYNKYKTNPASKHPFPCTHAELSAILDNRYADLRGTTAYVYRENNKGEFRTARPCEFCYAALKEAGIKRMVYTITNGYKEETL